MKTLTENELARIARRGKISIKDFSENMPNEPSQESLAVISVAKSVMKVAESLAVEQSRTGELLEVISRKKKAIFTPIRDTRGLITKIVMEEV